MLEPIIIKDYFVQSIQRELKRNKTATELMDLKLLEFSVLKEIMDNCGSFPAKHRINFCKFLFSLPNDYAYFELLNKRGTHPFYKNLELNFDLKDKFMLNKLKSLCSNLAFWSEEVGNVFFLPNIVFPFIKSFKGNDCFVFETLIALINCFCQYWFEFYPGAPLNHLRLCEKIIEKENALLFRFFKSNEKQQKEKYEKERFDKKTIYNSNNDKNKKLSDPINLKITEICWKFMQSFYSESLDKTSWLQLLDFLACNSHKPEILLYLNCALLLSSDKLIVKCRSIEELYALLFSQNLLKYPTSSCGKNMLKVFKLANSLYDKYSSYQLYKYTPHIPFENSQYKLKITFPLDFLGTTAAIKEHIFNEEHRLDAKKGQIELLEQNFNALLKREEKIQKTYECLVHKEREKAELLKRELDLILYQKQQTNQELKGKKLDKIGKLQSVVDNSMHLYSKMNENELKFFDEEVKTRKVLAEFDIKTRLQQEELNNLDFKANRKLIDLLQMRAKDELNQKLKVEDCFRDKQRCFEDRIHEQKWKIEDEAYQLNLGNIARNKEFELLKLRDQNVYLEKQYKRSQKEFENKLFRQQVEKERVGRNAEFTDFNSNNYSNNFGRTSIEENFLNSISKVSNKNNNNDNNSVNNGNNHANNYLGSSSGSYNSNCNNNYYNNNSVEQQQQIENELNRLIEDLRSNMANLELEEKALLEYEQDLLKREFDVKLLGLKKNVYSGEGQTPASQTSFKGNMNDNYALDMLSKIEAEKHSLKLKKNDMELRKQQISDNLSSLYNYNVHSHPSNQFSSSSASGKNTNLGTSSNNNNNYNKKNNTNTSNYNYFLDSDGNNKLLSAADNNNNNNNINNMNSLTSMSSSELLRLEKENQIREENEKLYKKIRNDKSNNQPNIGEFSEGNYSNNSKNNNNNINNLKLDSENRHSQSEALTSKFPYDNSFGDRSQMLSPSIQNTFGNNSRNDNNEIKNKVNNDLNQSK